MFPHNSKSIRIVLLALSMASFCRAEFTPDDPLPALDSFKLEGKLPDPLKGQVILLDFWASW